MQTILRNMRPHGQIFSEVTPLNDDGGDSSGHVRVYSFESGNWTQLGSDINGEAASDETGGSVSLNSNGDIVAIGAPDGWESDTAHARVYQLITNVCNCIFCNYHSTDKTNLLLNLTGAIISTKYITYTATDKCM